MTEFGIKDTLRVLFRQYVSSRVFGAKRIFNRFLVYEILQYFDGYLLQNANAKKGFLGFGLIHYSLITNAQPKRILCIGSKKGFVPAMCAMACKDIGSGHVDFVDAGYSEFDGNGMMHWGGIGFWKDQNPDDHFSFLDLAPYITTHVMTTKDFFRMNKTKYQYIYIDGDHTYEGVRNDFKMAWPRLVKNGYMLFHDISVTQIKGQLPYGVGRLWKSIKNAHKINIDTAAGLGILQKIS